MVNSRREFMHRVMGSLGGALTIGSTRVLGANDRIRFGIIGAGAQGKFLMRAALACPNTEFAAVADVYKRRLEEAKGIAPSAQTYIDYRDMLRDKDIDAVIIATPQHLHCEHLVASVEASKHVYLEKTMAFTVAHAKRMRTAMQSSSVVVQIGTQACSSVQMVDVRRIVQTGYLGKITKLHAYQYRNTPHGHPQWFRPVPPDASPCNIDWKAFLGEAPDRPFNANRLINWRFFWDYSGGNVFENMVHQVTFWYKALALGIPKTVSMRGGIYLWKDGREVPDTMEVTMEQPEEMLFVWSSGFGNDSPDESEQVLGTDGTLVRDGRQVTYSPQKVNRPDGKTIMGQTPKVLGHPHMQNFIDCVRDRNTPNSTFELGFRASIACQMAVASYRWGRPARWDAEAEEIL